MSPFKLPNPKYISTYLRTKNDTEIDLIIDRTGRPRALIEIKSSTAIRAENIKTLRNFKKEQSSVEAFCLSRVANEKLIDKARVMPWQNGIQKIFLDKVDKSG